MNITQARRKLLEFLVENGGTIMGSRLGGVGRSNASKMQAGGLVKWESPLCVSDRNDLGTWTLHITETGRAALAETKPNPFGKMDK